MTRLSIVMMGRHQSQGVWDFISQQTLPAVVPIETGQAGNLRWRQRGLVVFQRTRVSLVGSRGHAGLRN
jgi:hypothetical protein